MPMDQEMTAVLDRIDTATNNIAAVITTLRDQIKVSMTAEEVAIVKGNLTALATRLEGIAADPNVPVPPGPEPTFNRSLKG